MSNSELIKQNKIISPHIIFLLIITEEREQERKPSKTHQYFLQEAQVGLLLLFEVIDELGETLHVGRDIVLLHQVIPHGCGFADVLADLHQFAHHLCGTAEPRCGRAFRRSE